MNAEPDNLNKIAKQATRQFGLSVNSSKSTHLILTVIDSESNNNKINFVSCKLGMCLSGYVYDAQRDAYCVECCDMINFGAIPFAFQMHTKDESSWKIWVPIPYKILTKNLTSKQKAVYNKYKKKYPSAKYSFDIFQLLSTNS
jgi:hypothetical protein